MIEVTSSAGLGRIHVGARRAAGFSNLARAKAFKELFVNFLEQYQLELDKSRPREIDFNDMTSDATRHVRNGRFHVPWKYMIVDEFQDISVGRYLLLDSLLSARKDARFFAVG